MRVLSKLFRRLMLEKLVAAHAAGRLTFFGAHAALADSASVRRLSGAAEAKTRWYVYAKRPFAGPKAVLAYLSRYTHRVAISNRRLIAADAKSVTFKVKDYRIDGPGRYKTMTLATHEFIRRFLIHVLPKGFHRIRHYGLLRRAAPRPTTSRSPASCSPCRARRSRPSPTDAVDRRAAPRADLTAVPLLRSAACASSRCSSAARHRATGRPRCPTVIRIDTS